MTLPPCKKDGIDCTERYPCCQDTCEKFLAFKQKRKEEKDAIRKQRKEAHYELSAFAKRQNFK